MKQLGFIALGLGLTSLSLAGTLSVKVTSQPITSNWNQSWGGPNDSIWAAVTSALGTAGSMLTLGTVPSNGMSGNTINATMYQTASFQFGFHTVTNETPPATLYMHYSGATVAACLEPIGTFASYGTAVSSSSTFPNVSVSNAWNATGKRGIVHSNPPYEAVASNVVESIPSSAFGGWTLVKSSGSEKWYVSTGTWTMTTPTLAVGGILNAGTSFNSGSGWGFGYLFLTS